MSRWYMENGEYGEVDSSFRIAYDDDNSAWVELGSTPGSTPVWWSFYPEDGGGCDSGAIPVASRGRQEAEKRLSEIRSELKPLPEKIENCVALLEKDRKKIRKNILGMSGFCLYCLTIGFYFLDKPLPNGKYAGAPEAAVMTGIALLVVLPIYVVKKRMKLGELESELSENRALKERLEKEETTLIEALWSRNPKRGVMAPSARM